MSKFSSQADLVTYWAKNKSNLIALAHEFKDSTIQSTDNIPCHRSFNKTMFAPQKREDLRGAYVKLSYLTPGGYNYSGSGTEQYSDEYDPKCEAWYDYLVSRDGPWRSVECELLKDSNGRYRALHVPNIHKQQMQPWIQMCFSSRSGSQRADAIRLWYDLVHIYGFHKTEAAFIMSGLMYSTDQKTIIPNPLNYDWVFKGYNEMRTSFYNMWNGTPNIVAEGTLDKVDKAGKTISGAGEIYGMPNDIWVETDKDRCKATDFMLVLNKQEPYKGVFKAFFAEMNGGAKSFKGGVPSLDVAVGILKEHSKKWPR